MKRKHLHLPTRFTAALLALAFGCTCLTGCSDQEADKPVSSVSESAVTEQETEETAETEAETEAITETEPTTTAHVSPVETVTSALGTQIDVDAALNRNNDNTYQTGLSQFITEGDTVNSFTFVFYAGDGVSNIGTYKGGCGISVTGDCTAATDEGWYQSDDFSVTAQGSYCEVTWNVPAEIQPFVDPNGDVLVGYWWGNTTTVQLKNVICNYTRTAQLPVDATETIAVGQTLNFNNEETKSVNVSLADVLGEGCTPQAITFDIRGGGSFGKFTGAFGITTEKWHQTDTIAILTESSDLSLTWILPDEVKSAVPADAEVMLGYWWGETAALTLENITVKYAYGTGGAPEKKPESTENAESKPDNTENTDSKPEGGTDMTKANAAAIAADIKVGWNLGNSLDCYDVTKAETGWGNPVTTKAMIDTVKAAGFNAVRIPVSWTDHITDDGTIDSAWMDRVQEVVDYSMDNDLYTIINVHHDDYTWLNPTYAEEAAVKAKLTKIWTQIAARFQDYGGKLLFEGMNEPRIVGSTYEWSGGTAEERDVINHLHQAFVDTVRASGGNNPDRTQRTPIGSCFGIGIAGDIARSQMDVFVLRHLCIVMLQQSKQELRGRGFLIVAVHLHAVAQIAEEALTDHGLVEPALFVHLFFGGQYHALKLHFSGLCVFHTNDRLPVMQAVIVAGVDRRDGKGKGGDLADLLHKSAGCKPLGTV